MHVQTHPLALLHAVPLGIPQRAHMGSNCQRPQDPKRATGLDGAVSDWSPIMGQWDHACCFRGPDHGQLTLEKGGTHSLVKLVLPDGLGGVRSGRLPGRGEEHDCRHCPPFTPTACVEDHPVLGRAAGKGRITGQSLSADFILHTWRLQPDAQPPRRRHPTPRLQHTRLSNLCLSAGCPDGSSGQAMGLRQPQGAKAHRELISQRAHFAG